VCWQTIHNVPPPWLSFVFPRSKGKFWDDSQNSRWATWFSCDPLPSPPLPLPNVKFHIFTKRSELRRGTALQKPNSVQTLNLFLLVHTANSALAVTLPLSFPDALTYSQTAFARRTSGALTCKFQSSKMRDRRNSNNIIIQFLNFILSFVHVLV